jgi:Holliday junction resolvase RusA-like endonuclease
MNRPAILRSTHVRLVEQPPRAITVTLTFPPSANRLWRNIMGKTIKSEEYRDWIKLNDAQYLAQSAGRGWRTITGPYHLTILATAPDNRRRDLANLEKATSDFLQHAGAVKDDCNCRVLHMAWIKGPGSGVTCTVEPL